MAPEANHPFNQPLGTELSRDLGWAQLVLMGLGMMIGAGLFVGTGTVLYRTGAGGLLLVLALGGLLAMLSAMCYAELASAIPKTGGAYNFARVAFGRGWSFLAGWVEWCGTVLAGSLYAWLVALYGLGFAAGLGWLPWNHHSGHLSVRLLAVAVVAAMATLSGAGASVTGRLGACITAAQVAGVAIVALLGGGCLLTDPGRFANFEPFPESGSLAVLTTMGMVYVAFQGYVVISQAGDETIEPRRCLPRAILMTPLLATGTYLLAALGMVAAVSPADLDATGLAPRWPAWIDRVGGPDTVFAVAVHRLAPVAGPVLLVALVVCGGTAALNAVLFSATRSLFAMGRDHMLPASLARLSRRTRTPWIALVITWAAIAGLVWTVPSMTKMVSLTSVMFLVLSLLVCLCCLRIRRRMGDELSYGYVMPLFPLVPLVAILGNGALLVCLGTGDRLAWVACLGWVALGLGVYRLYGRRHAVSIRDEIISFRETAPPAKTGFRILLPVAHPDGALEKIVPTMRLAEVCQAQVELLHMVSIPDQVPLADAGRYMEAGREAVVEAMLYLQSRFPLHETIRYCRTPARGIVSAAREHEADLLILGWAGRSSRTDVLFGTTLDPILEQAPCDVIVLRNCRHWSYRQVLVPFVGGPNSLLALRIASILADPKDGIIRPFTVAAPGEPVPDAREFIGRQADQFVCPMDRFQPDSVVSRDIAGALAEAGRSADLVVVGATRTLRVARIAVTPLAEALASRLQCALIMVRAARPVSALVNRWL